MKSVKKQLAIDMKDAMEKGNKKKASVLKKLRALIKNKEIQKRKELSDKEVKKILYEKVDEQIKDINNKKHGNNKEFSGEVKTEIKVLAEYFPDFSQKYDTEKIQRS